MKEKAICLLSGGLDSTVSFVLGLKYLDVSTALTFDYGQKALNQEIKAAERICQLYGIVHQIINLQWLGAITKTALVSLNKQVPRFEFGKSEPKETMKEVWVPNRNGVFINIGAAFAEGLNSQIVVAGFNHEEAETFSDNSLEFMEAANQALKYSTLNGIRVVSFVGKLTKKDIVRLGVKMKAPLQHIWSCYEGGQKMCGRCESCQRNMQAFKSTDNWRLVEEKFSCE